MRVVLRLDMGEVWIDIKDYEGLYQVSNTGKVKRVKGKKRHLTVYNEVYDFVYLFKKSKRKVFKIHQLVAIHFLNHVPCNMKLVVHHLDGVKTNNNVTNLKIVTQRENMHEYYGKNVGITKRGNGWSIVIRIKRKPKYLGVCETLEEAIIHRDKTLLLIAQGNIDKIKVKQPIRYSNYKGVTFDKSRNKWKSTLTIDGVKYNIGRFNTEEEAIQACENFKTKQQIKELTF